jgi:Flp pilus assembly protein TadD
VQDNPVTFVGFLPDGRRAVVSGFSVRIYEVPGPVDGMPRRLTLWAQVATNMELIGNRNVIQSLDPKTWEDRRRQLLDAGGLPGAFASVQAEPEWHRAQALDARHAGQWFAAHWHLERLVAAGAGDGPVYAERGRALIGLRRRDEAQADFDRALQLGTDSAWIRSDRGSTHAMNGRWKAAVDDLARAVELQPDDYVLRLRHALALLGADDLDGHRRACVDMLDRLGDRRDSAAILALTAACNIVPGSVPDLDRIVRMADNPQMILFCQSHVAALYRAGRLQECLTKLEEAAKKGIMKSGWDQLYVANVMNRPLPPEYQEMPGVNNPTSGDLYYAAMALQRLGRADEARQFLDAASKLVDAYDKTAGNAIWPPWWSWVAAHRLRREAEALILGKAP